MIISFFWFIFFGWWLGLIATAMGYFLCATIIGLPLGTLIFNRLPSIICLRPLASETHFNAGIYPPDDIPFILRVIWFFVLGWELGLTAVVIGYFLCLTIIGMPVGIYILNRIPVILTLSRRYD